MKQAAVKSKKVSAYPIEGQLAKASEVIKGRIVKVTNVGVLIETQKAVALGDQFTVRFSLPVFETKIESAVVVIKTYMRHGGAAGASHHLNELHFRDLEQAMKLEIHRFITKIKQV